MAVGRDHGDTGLGEVSVSRAEGGASNQRERDQQAGGPQNGVASVLSEDLCASGCSVQRTSPTVF